MNDPISLKSPRSIRRPIGRNGQRNRRGMMVLLVLSLISVALAVSYAVMRSQITILQVQDNAKRKMDARSAAVAGITTALRRMHQSNWAGVDSILDENVGPHERFSVQYLVGDPQLTPNHSDYADFPYRVTLLSTGYATQPGNLNRTATHQVRAIVRLIPRSLSSQPKNWDRINQFTIAQTGNSSVPVQVPLQIEGPVHLEGRVKLCDDYPPNSRPFHGWIDDVAIFNHSLPDRQVNTVYRNSTAGQLDFTYTFLNPLAWWRLDEPRGADIAFDSQGTYHGNYVEAVPGNLGAPLAANNYAAYFDGQDDHINLGTLDVSGSQLTIFAWFKAESFANPDACIISKATGTSTGRHSWTLGVTKRGDAYRLRFRLRSGGWTQQLIASSGNLSPNSWIFAAAVYDGNTMKLFKNGHLVGRTPKTGLIDQDPSVPVWIGDNPPGSPRTRYLADLEARRVSGLDDFRPFSGPLSLFTNRNRTATLNLLSKQLNVPVTGLSRSLEPPSPLSRVRQYQIFPGGPKYLIPVLPTVNGTIRNVTLLADPVKNPLGIWRHGSRINVHDNVSIQGTIVTMGRTNPDIYIHGDNFHLHSVDLPPLSGTLQAIQLPVAIVKDDFRFLRHSSGRIRGLVYVKDDFEIQKGDSDRACDFEGCLIVNDLKLSGRSDWDLLSGDWWETQLNAFLNQLRSDSPIAFFPDYLEHLNLHPQPLLTFRPSSTPVAYHWLSEADPVYSVHPDDPGLRWDLIDWTDNP